MLRLEGADAVTTARAAGDVAARARAGADPGCRIRGPAPAPLERLRGRYRWQVLIASESTGPLHVLIRALLGWWRRAALSRKVRLIVDVDPVSML
jgi:primosomal protein N' (replication factor Y)